MRSEFTEANSTSFLLGGGEMGNRIRSHDWSQTPLGLPEQWPQSLKTTVRIILTSRQPMFVWWGDELLNLYNDAYAGFLHTKHPDALGRPASEVWREVWEQLEPRIESVIHRNEGTFDEAQFFIMERKGYREETYITFSYSPIPDDKGSIGGLLCACTDDTQRIIGERQLALLRELAATTADARTFDETCTLSATSLETNPYDLPFALIYLVESNHQQATLAGMSGMQQEHSLALPVVTLDQDSVWRLGEVVRSQRPVLVSTETDLPTGAWQEAPHLAVALPIFPTGQTGKSGILVVGLNPFRQFDEDYQGFLNLVSGQIAASIANAQAYEEERKRAEALAEIDRAKTVFFSNVSHEFRTPLTLILSPLEELSNTLDRQLQPDQREQLQLIQRNALRLQKLVNTLLDFSRIEAGRIQASYEPTDLAAYTAELASTFRSLIEQAGMALMIDCSALLEPVYVDCDMWEKIVLNLLSNAFKFTFTGSIAVQLQPVGSSVELSVTDTGVGIPEAELPRLFERFHRVSGTRSRTYEGSGIGLALVQELVKLHGGTIQVTSHVDRGTTFTIAIPFGTAHLPQDRIDATRTLASTALGANPYVIEASRWISDSEIEGFESRNAESLIAVPTQSKQSSTPPARILLVDDNADMRDYGKRLLRQYYEVETVSDGFAALEAIAQRPPDLVLSDVMMPGLDGFGLLRELRANPRTQEIPMILLSARAGEESRIEGLEAGADDYLTKPFSVRELLARVEVNLKLAQLRQAAAQKEQALRVEVQAARDRLESVLTRITDQFIALDRDWRYTYVNDRVTEVSGIDRENLLGQNFWEIFPDVVGSQFEVEVRRAAAEGTPIQFEYFYPTWNRWFENNVYPSVDGVSIITTDITDRKRTEEALRESLAILNTVNEVTPTLIYIKDRQRRLQMVNPATARLLGKSEAELIGKTEIDYLGPEEAEQIAKNDCHVMESGQVVVFEELVVVPEGNRIFLSAKAPYRDEQGNIIGLIGVSTDISDRKQAEATLQESERRFRRLVESNMFGVAFGDFTGSIHYANDYFLRMIGYTRAEFETGQVKWTEMTPPEFLLLDNQAIAELRTKGVATPFEKEYVRKDGTRVPILIGSALLQEPYDQQQDIIAFFVDLSDRKQAESQREYLMTELEAERVRFEAVLRQMPEGVIIADAASERMILANERTTQILQYSFELNLELESYDDRTPFHAYHSDGRMYAPEDYPLMRSLRRGEIINQEEMEFRYLDGKRLSLEVSSAPILDGKGQITAAVALMQDITERKHIEQALRASEALYRTLSEAVPDFIWSCDVDGQTDFVNPRWVDYTGLTLAELNAGGLAQITYPDDFPRLREAWESAKQKRELLESEFRYRRKDGEYRWFMERAVPIKDDEGNIVRWIGTVTDIHERKQAEAECEQLLAREQAARKVAETTNRIKDEFLAVLSHELRSPLNPILGWSQLLRSGKLDATRTDLALATIERNAKLQAELIEDLLDVSRILQGRLSLNVEPIHLATTIQSALETVRLSAEAKAITIEVRLDANDLQTLGDSTRLQQVVWNLLSNAVKFTPAGGRVEVNLQQVDGQAQITVRDTGRGIPPSFLPHVFDYFRQEDGTTTRKFGGLGLGLAIVRHLVELHGGTVRAESPGEGQGATFTVNLPLILVLPPLAHNHSTDDLSLNLDGLKVLVIDDNPDSLELVVFVLEEAGANVTTASTAAEGFLALTQSPPDILLSDIGMPDMDGYMLMRQVRGLPPEQGGQVKAIALTAYAGDVNYQQAIQAGYQHHLAKPIRPAMLIQVVAEVVAEMRELMAGGR